MKYKAKDDYVCYVIWPKKKIPVFPLTRQTLFFRADAAISIVFQKKKKKQFPTLKCSRKLDKNFKNVSTAKLML